MEKGNDNPLFRIEGDCLGMVLIALKLTLINCEFSEAYSEPSSTSRMKVFEYFCKKFHLRYLNEFASDIGFPKLLLAKQFRDNLIAFISQ